MTGSLRVRYFPTRSHARHRRRRPTTSPIPSQLRTRHPEHGPKAATKARTARATDSRATDQTIFRLHRTSFRLLSRSRPAQRVDYLAGMSGTRARCSQARRIRFRTVSHGNTRFRFAPPPPTAARFAMGMRSIFAPARARDTPSHVISTGPSHFPGPADRDNHEALRTRA